MFILAARAIPRRHLPKSGTQCLPDKSPGRAPSGDVPCIVLPHPHGHRNGQHLILFDSFTPPMGTDMRPFFKRASCELNSFSNFCLLTTFDN